MFKIKDYRRETDQKSFRKLFESVKIKAKKKDYSDQISKCRYDVKEAWGLMKEVIRKKNCPRILCQNIYSIIKLTSLINRTFNKRFIGGVSQQKKYQIYLYLYLFHSF